MPNTPNLNLPYILPNQAQKHVTHNEAIRALDALVQLSVTDRVHATPPVQPIEGQRFIVANGASGEWSGKDGSIAAWQDNAWAFLIARKGWLAFVEDEDKLAVHDGTDWVSIEAGVNPVAMVGVNTIADGANRFAAKSDSVLFSHDDVTPGSGDIRQIINKVDANHTASQVYQSGWSGRAETGLTGSDDFEIKVSGDGGNWHQALVIEKNTGSVSMPNSNSFGFWRPSRGANSQIGFSSHQLGHELGVNNMSPAWMIVYAMPIGSRASVDRMTLNVFEAGTDQIGLALYAAHSDHAPGILIADFGTADCATTGLKTLTLASPVTLEPGLYWIAALPSSGTARLRGNSYPRDLGAGATPAGTLIRSGFPFRVNIATHSISFWNPPATLENLETVSGQLDPYGMHCPAVLLQ